MSESLIGTCWKVEHLGRGEVRKVIAEHTLAGSTWCVLVCVLPGLVHLDVKLVTRKGLTSGLHGERMDATEAEVHVAKAIAAVELQRAKQHEQNELQRFAVKVPAVTRYLGRPDQHVSVAVLRATAKYFITYGSFRFDRVTGQGHGSYRATTITPEGLAELEQLAAGRSKVNFAQARKEQEQLRKEPP